MTDREIRPNNERETIKELIGMFRMLWDDIRPSQDVAPFLGVAQIQVFSSTPDSVQTAQKSPEKAQVMAVLNDALGMTSLTLPFRQHILEGTSAQYNFGLSSEYPLSFLGVKLEGDDLGVLEKEKAHGTEKIYLETAIKSACLRVLGHHFILIPEQEEEKMSYKEAALLLSQLFQDEGGKWLDKETLRELEDKVLPGGFALLRFKFAEITKTIDWADAFKETYQDNLFAESINLIRPVLQYAGEENRRF